MMNLAEYRRTATRLADFLPWAALVGEGVVLNKDGSFQRTLRFRGPDMDSATPSELMGEALRLNNVLRRFGSGVASQQPTISAGGGAKDSDQTQGQQRHTPRPTSVGPVLNFADGARGCRCARSTRPRSVCVIIHLGP